MDAQPITPWFAWASRELARACLSLELAAPSFRSPPAVPGADRTLRWLGGGGGEGVVAVVAVRLWGRDFAAIRADMVDGILAANGLVPGSAERDRLRAVLEKSAPVPGGREAA